MKCKIIVNSDSGNCDKLNVDALVSMLGCRTQVEIIDSKSDWSADNFDTVVVCGGDGTLHHAIEKCPDKHIVYVPCGTLNETSMTEREITSIGSVNGRPFSYVCAAGSFTEIGYSAKNDSKKRWKSLAYLPQIFRCYRCHNIAAKLDVDGRKFEGNYTLLMVLKSHRCFGFQFNSDYKKTKKTYLLAVRSFGKDNLKNRAKMFFPFFRIFFCKAKPSIHKNWMLLPFDKLSVSLSAPQDFCFDGEKRVLRGNLHFSSLTLAQPITVVKTPLLKEKRVPPPKRLRT